jgi:hypothetical protein
MRLLLVPLAAALLCCGPAAARERPATTPAARFVQDTIDRALGLVRPPVSDEAGSDLTALIEGAMDWPSLAHFAMGRHGAAISPDGMRSATDQLEQRLVNLARRAGAELPAMTVAIHDMRIGADGNRRILGTAALPRFGEIDVEWVLAPTGTGYRIADIRALGMSLRQFLRSWIAGWVAAHGGDAAAAFGEGAASPR